jgi:cell division protein ZapA (FtsZ GTPase activity inhibitor)
MNPPFMPQPSTTASTVPASSGSRVRRPRLSSGALRRLDIALRLAGPDGDEAGIAELRDAVCEQVMHLRAQGEPPERVLVEIKREIQEAQTRVNTPRGDEPALRTLTDQVVRWCIDAYYRGD